MKSCYCCGQPGPDNKPRCWCDVCSLNCKLVKPGLILRSNKCPFIRNKRGKLVRPTTMPAKVPERKVVVGTIVPLRMKAVGSFYWRGRWRT